MKKILSMVLTVCMVLSLCATLVGAQDGMPLAKLETKDIIKITVDGKYVDCASYGQLPVIVEGRTLVPLRSVFEALGATVEWNNEQRSVKSVKGEVEVVLAVDSKEMAVNGTVKTLDVPAQIMNDRTMVPVRAVAEAFGAKVEWNNDTRTVIITTVAADANTEAALDTAAAEATVLSAWKAILSGDYELATSYIGDEEFAMETKNFEAEMLATVAEETGLNAGDEAIAEIMLKYVRAMLSATEVKVVSSEVISADKVGVTTVTISPDLSTLETEELVTEEVLMEILIAVIEEFGYTLDTVETAFEEDQAYIMEAYKTAAIIYSLDVIAENVHTFEKFEGEPETTVVQLIDGKWLMVE